MTDPTAYHRKLSEACCDRIDKEHHLRISKTLRSFLAAALAAEGVMDPKEVAALREAIWRRLVEIEKLEAALAEVEPFLRRYSSDHPDSPANEARADILADALKGDSDE